MKIFHRFKPNYLVVPLIVIFISWFSSLATFVGIDSGWYDSLIKPNLNPPNWIFGPVWTLIYILTTVSFLIFWNKIKKDKYWYLLLMLFIYNAIVNFSWSFAFFKFNNIGTALWLATEIWFSVLLLMVFLWPRSKLAALLLTPYLLWVSFATYLNYMLWSLN